MGTPEASRIIRSIRLIKLHWKKGITRLLICATAILTALIAAGFYHIYFDRSNLPDIGPFARFEFPTIGRVYDANDKAIIEIAREYRQITTYENIPPIVRDAIIVAEDKNFFSHNGFDYSIIPRVLAKVRIRALVARFVRLGGRDEANDPVLFPKEDRQSPNSLYAVIFS